MMRVFFLGGRKSQEVDMADEYQARRHADTNWQRARELAIEIAPGVHVAALGWGTHILPGRHTEDGVEYPNTGEGVQVAVWAEDLVVDSTFGTGLDTWGF